MPIYNNILTLSKVYQLSIEGSWYSAPTTPSSIEYLIVGGGGGAGAGSGTFYGGGGGGGAAANTGTFSQATLTTSVITISVGAGGAGGYTANSAVAANGGNSSILFGATTVNTGIAGYSGGNAGGNGGTSGNGNGPGSSNNGNGRPSSGGGSGRAGYNWDDATFPGQGGYGTQYSSYDMYGTDTSNSTAPSSGKGYFGAGGSQSGWYATNPGRPASYGGGGRGNTGSPGSPGLPSTGGGGGGGGADPGSNGGNGGSGLVVVRYPVQFADATTTGSPNVTVSGGYKYYAFTSSGTMQFTS